MSKKRDLVIISETESESEPESDSGSFMTESDDEDVEDIDFSSSCDDDDDDEEDDDDDEEEEEEEDEDDDDVNAYDYYEDDDYESDWNDSDHEDLHVDKDDGDDVFDKVLQCVRGKGDLQQLKLIECRVYLRRHGLRLAGTKEECIERIKEHWRLKDGNSEALYPRSSFKVDCTGDVCKGDVVLFSQKVYQSFDKMKRHGRLLGRRTVAGRIVKESYGAAKQQHTFTVEVLWSQGAKKLAPLFPLLVKGRNLYKLKTHRQYWKNEQERLEVLAEKHQRGAAARNVRAMRKTKMVRKTTKSSTHKGTKRSKHFHHLGPSGTKERSRAKKNTVIKQGKSMALKKKQKPCKNLPPIQASSSKQTRDLRGRPASHRRHQNLIQNNQVKEPPYVTYNPIPFNPGSSIQNGDRKLSALPRRDQNPNQDYHVRVPSYVTYSNPSQRELHPLPSNISSSSMSRLPPYSSRIPNSVSKPVSEWQEYRRGNYSQYKKFNRLPR